MNRLAVSFAALSAIALAACASEPEDAPMAAAPTAAPAVEAPPPAPPVKLAEPAEKVPFQVVDSATGKIIPAGESTTADMPKEPVMAAAPAKPDKRTIVYLASYKTQAGAQTGWKILAQASPILAKQKPVTQNVDLGAKGKFVRLYGMAADEAERATICKQVGKRVDECGARNRE